MQRMKGTEKMISVGVQVLLIAAVIAVFIPSAKGQYCSRYGFYCYNCTAFQTCIDGVPVGDPVVCPKPFACNMNGILECTLGRCSLPTAAPTTTTTTTTTTTPAPEFECQYEGRFPDPFDQTKYYICLVNPDSTADFLMLHVTCPSGSAFSPELSICQSIPTTALPSTLNPSTTAPTTEAGTTSESITEVPAESTSATPAESTTGIPSESTTGTPSEPTTGAPAEPTTRVPAESTTGVPSESTSDKPNEPTTEVPTESTTGVPAESTTGASVESTTGAHSEPTTASPTENPETVTPSETTVGGYTTTTSISTSDAVTDSTTESTTTTTQKPTTTTKPPGFVCRRVGVFPDPESCRTYYRCLYSPQPIQGNNLVAIKYTCPRKKLFSARWERCVDKRKSECKRKSEDENDSKDSDSEEN